MSLIIRHLGLVPYESTWQAMRDFTAKRNAKTLDEIWCLQHPPVFTQGQAGKAEHLLNPGDIPMVQSDRGGQVTYHGPGQLVVYLLFDLKRLGLGVKAMVALLEEAIIRLLAEGSIEAERRADAPGVYVQGAKVAALGLRVRHGCCYHGLSLNHDLDLAPFGRINPCGYPGLEVTSLARLGWSRDMPETKAMLLNKLKELLCYSRQSKSN